jgi:hypothetical protein
MLTTKPRGAPLNTNLFRRTILMESTLTKADRLERIARCINMEVEECSDSDDNEIEGRYKLSGPLGAITGSYEEIITAIREQYIGPEGFNGDMAGLRGEIAYYFEAMAAFRSSCVEKEPASVGKNGAYAESLYRMAAYVLALSEDDPMLTKLATCSSLFFPGLFQIPQFPEFGRTTEADNFAIHCGPRGSVIQPGDCNRWFAEWVELVVAESGFDWDDELEVQVSTDNRDN